MLAFSIDYYGVLFRATQSVGLFCTYLTDKIDDRTVYMKGIDASYHYEGYNVFKTDELS